MAWRGLNKLIQFSFAVSFQTQVNSSDQYKARKNKIAS